MSVCVGIDLSSKAVDLVRLDENKDEATWVRLLLDGAKAWDRIRQIRGLMPPGSMFWDDVYLVAIERPFIRAGQDVVRLAEGAVLACIPAHLQAWEVSVSQWKKALGIPIREKPDASAFPGMLYTSGPNGEVWPQDAFDALGVALYARETNANGIAQALWGAA